MFIVSKLIRKNKFSSFYQEQVLTSCTKGMEKMSELKIELPLDIHPVAPDFLTWNDHQKTYWQIGKPANLVSDLFCGKLYGFTRKEGINSAKVLRHYPDDKKTIIRIAGVFLRPVKVRDLWLTGMFETPPKGLPPWPILPCGRKAAQWRSPHLVLEPDNERIPHTSTPLFPMIDTLTVKNLEGKTLEEAFAETDLADHPISENWVDTMNFVLPPEHATKDPTGLLFRKSTNYLKNIGDFPLIQFIPGQLVIWEFINDSICLRDLVASWNWPWMSWLTNEWRVNLRDYIDVIPFAVFELNPTIIKRFGTKWKCIQHNKQSTHPVDLRCCFPPRRRESSSCFAWFIELSPRGSS
jgi:hypothetical protein